MKSNFFDFLHKINSKNLTLGAQGFKKIAYLTFIVYFITSFCGWFNFLLANINGKNYFPLRSYLLIFDKSSLINFQKAQDTIYNLAGFKVEINTLMPYKLIDDLFFILISTILVILFYIGYKIVQTNKISQGEIIKWSIVFSVLMIVAIPSHSSDLYGYIARGAQQSLYIQNPYLETVSSIKGYSSNPLFLNFMWPSQPTTYGPVFVYLTKVIVFLNNNNFFLSFINFKLFNLILFFLLILFVQRMSKAKDVYLISWNPLILVQGLWNCHNDLFSGILIFFGLYLIVKENYFWSIFCLTLAAGVKYVPLIIIPLIFFYFLRTKPEKSIFLNLVLGFCCGMILIFIFSIDYLIPTNQLALNHLGNSFNKLFSNISLTHKSFISTIITLIKYFCRWQNIDCNLTLIEEMLKYCFYFIFGIFYFWILLKKKKDLIFDIILVVFVFFSFIIAKFHSWYLLNLIILIPFLRNNLLKNFLIVLSMSHTFAITFLDQAKILNFLLMTLIPIVLVFFKWKNKK